MLKSIIKFSQHDWCKKPDQRNSKHLSLFESTNQCNATVGLPTLCNAWQRSHCTEAQIQGRYEDIPNRLDAGVLM